MQHHQGEGDRDWCCGGSVCAEPGWTCPESPAGPGGPWPCRQAGSLSRDVEGSCQSEPQGCPAGPCRVRSCRPAPQTCSAHKPRRRVELSPEQPPGPAGRIHGRPLQQYRPPLRPCQPGGCKPRRRAELRPVPRACPPGPLPPRRPAAPCQRVLAPAPCQLKA